jgi:hypothetical protein
VGIVVFLLCFCVSDFFVFFRSVCVYFAVMFVLFVENAKSFSLESFVASSVFVHGGLSVASVLSHWCRSVAFQSITLLVQIKVMGLLVV